MTHPSYTVTCSCGRRTTIEWEGECYVSLAPFWDSSYPAGWTCGREGHTQRVPPKKLEPTPAYTRLNVLL